MRFRSSFKSSLGAIHKGCPCLEDGGRGGSTKSRHLRTLGEGGQPNVDVHIEKKNDFQFFIIIWKYFLSNINVMFQYSVLDKTRLDCNMYPSPLYARAHIHTHKHTYTHFTYIIISLPQ